ncbi:hypothetical protein [Mycobacterium sp. 236(2023)]|uniref:hypothetical protein n=1 Tax=Mycobacterium sp. 236(2023) TaxID=3038163 RepID=UPI00241558B8|nr:hypothetical protein [Mycobacterium sp. 236(2023)]MDG4666274.1 hypothetical protein [Mycobacterium sp. 236(2023)]
MAAINPGIVRARRLFRYRILYWLIGAPDRRWSEATTARQERRRDRKTQRPHRREDFIEEAAMMREMRRL